MYQNWLIPISAENLEKRNFAQHHIGKSILSYQDLNNFPDLSAAKVAIIGIDTAIANEVRGLLYHYQQNLPEGTLVDLGNAANDSIPFLQPVIADLIKNKILVLLIAQKRSSAISQIQAYRHLKEKINIVCIDDKIRYSLPSIYKEDYLNDIVSLNFIQQLSVIGVQAHLLNAHHVDFFDRKGFEYTRLGKVKDNIEEQEPLLREAEALIVQLSALKNAEAPNQLDPTPSGFLIEEICQLVRYAGLNERLSSVGFYGIKKKEETLLLDQQTAHCIAQMMWYLLDGLINCVSDYPISTEGLIEYIVDIRKYDYKVSFWKSSKTGRWWIQIPLNSTEKTKDKKLIPCTYKDYLSTCNQELPDRLFNAYGRMF